MNEEDRQKARERQLDEWMGGQEFYELLQCYRMQTLVPQSHVIQAFKAIQVAIRTKVREIYGAS